MAVVAVVLGFAARRSPPDAAPVSVVPVEQVSRCLTTRVTPAVRTEGVAAICDDVYAETGLDVARVDQLRMDADLAVRNVERFFGALRSRPLVFFCQSPACKMALGASPDIAASDDLGFANPEVTLEDGAPVLSAVVASGPFESTSRVLTHERVHAEMKTWIAYDSLPTWFNEGTATYIASEPPCIPGKDAGIDVAALSTNQAWQRHLDNTAKVHETYCAARAKVDTWMQRFESDAMRAEALKTLMTSVRRGTPFETAFDAN